MAINQGPKMENLNTESNTSGIRTNEVLPTISLTSTLEVLASTKAPFEI